MGLYDIDSTSPAVCYNRRIGRHKVFANLTGRGKTIIAHIKKFSSLGLRKHRSVCNALTHLIAALVACQINPLPPTPIRAFVP